MSPCFGPRVEVAFIRFLGFNIAIILRKKLIMLNSNPYVLLCSQTVLQIDNNNYRNGIAVRDVRVEKYACRGNRLSAAVYFEIIIRNLNLRN